MRKGGTSAGNKQQEEDWKKREALKATRSERTLELSSAGGEIKEQ